MIEKKNIIICDIDGTISRVGDRLKYLKQTPTDWDAFYSACFDDEPIEEICKLINDLESSGYEIIFCTGRRELVREQTREWISQNVFESYRGKLKVTSIKENGKVVLMTDFGMRLNADESISFVIEKPYRLLMRPNDDLRHDVEVKPELLQKHLTDEERARVAFILEDRDCMVAKWRELGYRCLQVDKGEF